MFLLINYLIFGFLFYVSSESSRLHGKNRQSWGYEVFNGPEQWRGVCQSGAKQSPINIKLEIVKLKNYPSFIFDKSYHIKRQMSVKNNGHTVQASIRDNFTKPFFYGGGLDGKYTFEHLHLHWESEHEFEGKRADLEMHLVHFNEKYRNFSEAAIKQDGLAVFAVLFDISNETNDGIENFFDYLTKSIFQDKLAVPEIPSKDNTINNNNNNNNFEETTFSLRDFLPKQAMRFFRYEGSLTTPGCDEVVQWTVFTNRFPISNKAVKTLRTLPDHHGNLLLHNYRPPQKLNGRDVYFQILNEDAEDHSNNTDSINKRLSIYFVFACVFIHLKLII